MNTKEVKEHYKVFFGKDIPEPHVEFFGSEFIEFCLYIAGKAAQHALAEGGATVPAHDHNFSHGLHCSVCGQAQF